jgi:hypothetical protein
MRLSAVGTTRTCPDVRVTSAIEGISDLKCSLGAFRILTQHGHPRRLVKLPLSQLIGEVQSKSTPSLQCNYDPTHVGPTKPLPTRAECSGQGESRQRDRAHAVRGKEQYVGVIGVSVIGDNRSSWLTSVS